VHNDYYIFGVKLALQQAGMQDTAALPAEELSATLKTLPPETSVNRKAVEPGKDPKDPRDVGRWSESGPFGGDNLSALGIIPEATANFGY